MVLVAVGYEVVLKEADIYIHLILLTPDEAVTRLGLILAVYVTVGVKDNHITLDDDFLEGGITQVTLKILLVADVTRSDVGIDMRKNYLLVGIR